MLDLASDSNLLPLRMVLSTWDLLVLCYFRFDTRRTCKMTTSAMTYGGIVNFVEFLVQALDNALQFQYVGSISAHHATINDLHQASVYQSFCDMFRVVIYLYCAGDERASVTKQPSN